MEVSSYRYERTFSQSIIRADPSCNIASRHLKAAVNCLPYAVIGLGDPADPVTVPCRHGLQQFHATVGGTAIHDYVFHIVMRLFHHALNALPQVVHTVQSRSDHRNSHLLIREISELARKNLPGTRGVCSIMARLSGLQMGC